MSPRNFLRCSLTCSLLAVFCFAAADTKPLLAIAAICAGIGSAAMTRGGLLRTLPRFAINLMVLAATGNVFLQVLSAQSVEGSVISDLTDFLVFILLVKMFDRGRARDEAQLIGLSMFVVIGAVLTSNTLLTGVLLILFTPLCIITVILHQLYCGVQRLVERDHAGKPGPVPIARALLTTPRARRDFTLTTATALALSLAFGVVGFVFTPRTLSDQGGGWGLRRGAETGFRDNITLGQAGGISISTEPVMDVVLTDEKGKLIVDRTEPLYMRGAVLDVYDPSNGSWKSRPKREGRNQTPPSVQMDKEQVVELKGSTAGRQKLTQHVSIRRSRSERNVTLFSLWRPTSVAFDEPGLLYHSEADDVTLQRVGTGDKVGYTVVSSPDSLEENPSPPLPAFDSPRIRELTVKVMTAASVPLGENDRDPALTRRGAVAVVEYLRSGYAYTLEMVAPAPGQDPIEMFLFDTKKGHCEYFASAMTAMLRSVGIDARIVTGYAGGEFNAVNNQYVIRRSDAHAWVEVRLRPERWETFDPTPPGSLPLAQRQAYFGSWIVGQIRHFYEAIEIQWVDSVVTFSRGPKLNLLEIASQHRDRVERVQNWLRDLTERMSTMTPGKSRLGGALLLVITIVGVVGAVVFVGRVALSRIKDRLGRSAPLARPTGPRIKAYETYLARLRKAGLAKPSHTPPLAHARSIASANKDASLAAQRFVDTYYSTRFGGSTALDAHTASTLLRDLATALEKPTPPA